MKRHAVSVLAIAGLLSVLLSGCQVDGGTVGTSSKETGGAAAETTLSAGAARGDDGTEKTDSGTAQPGGGAAHPGGAAQPGGGAAQPGGGATETDASSGDPAGGAGETAARPNTARPYQFVRTYGIVQSASPVYELDSMVEMKLPLKEKNLTLTFAIRQDQELIVSMVLDDLSRLQTIPAGVAPPADGPYYTLRDGTRVVAQKYQSELWKSGEGLFLTGPGIPKEGLKPAESSYISYSAYLEAYGHMRYFIEARFELPPAPKSADPLSGYALRVLDFEKPLKFTLKPTPEYGTLEELAAAEHGSIETHDGISIISMGEKVDEGILVSWYVHTAGDRKAVALTYKPPLQEIELPTLSGESGTYPIKQLEANPHLDMTGHYKLSDAEQLGRRTRCLFDVPQGKKDQALQVNIPGITFLNPEESPQITLKIPEDYQELNEEIPFKDGSVRILGITKMKEPQILVTTDAYGKPKEVKRPAVYIDVAAAHETKNLALKGLICQRKLPWTGWEHERYDFDRSGNLSGFRVFYEEGDTEVTLKFNGAAFYWDQEYVMPLEIN